MRRNSTHCGEAMIVPRARATAARSQPAARPPHVEIQIEQLVEVHSPTRSAEHHRHPPVNPGRGGPLYEVSQYISYDTS